MEMEARVGELTAAFLDAQNERILEELSERLKQAGDTDLLPTHRALFDLVKAHVRRPSHRRPFTGSRRALSGFSRAGIRPLLSGQIALWEILHRMLREVEGLHKAMGVIHTALALAGDAVDGILGLLIDSGQPGGLSVAAPRWGTLVELGRTHREFQTLNRTVHDLLNTRDPAPMFEILEQGILDTFHLRSLVIAVVNHEEGFVEKVHGYPAFPLHRGPLPLRFDLSHPDILCDVARTGRTEVIDGWDPRYHEWLVQADGSVVSRQHPRDFNAGQTAFFVPILARGRVIGVVCTGSTQESKPLVLREIERMRPFLHQVGATLSNISEIAEHRRAEEALRRSEATNQALLEAIPDLIFRHSRDGVFLDFKPAKDFDPLVPPGEFLGKRVDEVLPAEVAQKAMLYIEQAIRTGDVQIFEYQLPVHGEVRDFEARVVICGEGEVLGIVRDITERRQLEGRLRQAQKMEAVGRLAGGIAHDFNNLLQVITGFSELLLARLDPGDPSCKEVEEIRKAGDRAASLTRQLLAFGRRQVLRPEVLDLNALVSNLGQMLRRLISADVDLVTVLRPGLGRVKADPGQIEQVIMNLAVNARDAMPEGGKLTIETENIHLDEAYIREHPESRPGPHVRLAVRDTGCGIGAEVRPHLFEPFFTTKEEGKGTGLGLATVYGIVTQSGGSVSISSEPEKGSVFSIYLPRVEDLLETAPSEDALIESPRGSETLLLVEGDDLVRNLVCKILRKCGYGVLETSDSLEALRVSGQHPGPIHLMVTDVVMPQMNGHDLAQRLAPLRPEMRVLYISGYTDDAVLRRDALEGDIHFLQKPFTPDALARKVREVLDA